MITQGKYHIAIPPGETLREQLKLRKITQKAFAAKIGVTPIHLNRILNGKVSITRDFANKLEREIGISALFWLKLQLLYNLQLLEIEAETERNIRK